MNGEGNSVTAQTKTAWALRRKGRGRPRGKKLKTSRASFVLWVYRCPSARITSRSPSENHLKASDPGTPVNVKFIGTGHLSLRSLDRNVTNGCPFHPTSARRYTSLITPPAPPGKRSPSSTAVQGSSRVMRAYEIVYILDAALAQAAVDAKLETFHATLGGEITTVDHWGVRQLAYPIGKAKTGYYVIVQVAAEPTALPEFERLLKLDEETMRYLVVLNEGQPTSGASILADRPAPAAAESEDAVEGDDVEAGAEVADEENPGDEGDEDGGADEEGEDEGDEGGEEEEDAEEGDGPDDEAADSPPSSGPPPFTGARGRRRRHEGPPIVLLNYKDVATLSRFLTEQGKILPKRTTKVSARFQRQLGTAVKRARHLALLPYIKDHGV
ncbi:MAG: 30S ribosomal protein S18 [Gemmatimonadetes bacterium]|nr:30S ribosomal protein S18 [Gemmatimonadota bacterium]